MKKLIALLLVLCMVLALGACSKGGDSSNGGTATTENNGGSEEGGEAATGVAEGSNKSASGSADTDVYLDIWGVWDADNYRVQYWKEKAAEFCKQYEEETGISVTIDYVPQDGYNGVAEKLTAGSVSNQLPVMAQMEESFLFQFHPICTDLGQYLSQDVIDNYLPGLMVSAYYDGTLYAVPAGRSYVCLGVNMDLLTQAGHTLDDLKDWDGFHKCAADIAALGDNIEGASIYWDTDAWLWESALYSNGGSICTDDGKTVTFADDNAGGIYLDLVKEMLLDGSAYSMYGQVDEPTDAYQEKFANGELGLFMESCTAYGSVKDAISKGAKGDFEIVITDQPAGKGGNSVVTGGSNFIVCNTATETQKQVAAAYLTYLAQDENVVEWNNLSGYLAFTKSAYESEAFKETSTADPNLVQIGEGVQYAHARPQTKHWREMYTYIYDNLVDFAMHPENADPEQLVKDMADYCQKIVDNG